MAFLSLLTGRAGLYALLTIGAAVVLAWFHHDIVAPYKARIADLSAQVTQLQKAAAQSQAIQEADARQAELDRESAAQANAQLMEIIRVSSLDPGACRFDAITLRRLRVLAGYANPDASENGPALPEAIPGLTQ